MDLAGVHEGLVEGLIWQLLTRPPQVDKGKKVHPGCIPSRKGRLPLG